MNKAVKLKVLFIVTEDWYFLSHRLLLAKALLHNGYEIHVATNPGPSVPQIESFGFKHHSVYFDRATINPIHDLRTVLELRRVFTQLKPDIVHNVAIKPLTLGSIAAIGLSKIKIVNAVTGLGYSFSESNLKAKIARFVILYSLKLALKH